MKFSAFYFINIAVGRDANGKLIIAKGIIAIGQSAAIYYVNFVLQNICGLKR